VDDFQDNLELLRNRLEAEADAVRADKLKSYLKSPLDFYGVTVAAMRPVARDFRKANPEPGYNELHSLCGLLWSSRYHEERTLAVILLEYYPGYLDMRAMPRLDDMLGDCVTWDHVDGIATFLVGKVLEKDQGALEYLERWSHSDNFWFRRAALIAQIRQFRKGKGDAGLFFRFAEAMIEESEFFVRKAIGWALRELSKAEPDAVYDFLLTVKDRAAPLTLKEGARRLPEKQKAVILET
jgi:3-methyladenine DNA glycosylase AlkD